MANTSSVLVRGAGILGLWQALMFARAGHAVTLVDTSETPFETNASRLAGTMLAPDCEAESAPDIVRDMGHHGLALWKQTVSKLTIAGSLVVANARDQADLTTFARKTANHQLLTAEALAALEPDLKDQFQQGLYFPDEAHITTPETLTELTAHLEDLGVTYAFGAASETSRKADLVIDCSGLQAQGNLQNLRGVRGERILIKTDEVTLSRPVRLLHPRHPIYIVPWTNNRFMVGATMLESEDAGPMTVRSALELLGTAYAINPAFSEAQILEFAAATRPAFPDNVPKAIVRDDGKQIFVNGAYRHGYLLAPVLAEAVVNFVANNTAHPLVHTEN